MRPPNRLAAVAVALLVVGAPVLFLWANPVTLTIGAVALIGFVVVGVFAIATPEDLGREDGPADPDGPAG